MNIHGNDEKNTELMIDFLIFYARCFSYLMIFTRFSCLNEEN